MSEHPYRILIVNWEDRSSIVFLPQVLLEAGCEVHAFTPASNMLARAKGVSRVYEAPSEFSEFEQALFQHISTASPRYNWIIPAEDSLLYRLVAHRASTPWIDDLLPTRKDPALVERLLSKSHFLALANSLGLPIPPTVICHDEASARRSADQVTFPLVVKNNLGYNGFGSAYMAGKADLLHYLETGKQLIYPLALQTYLPGEPGTTWALFDHGRLISWASCLTPYTHIQKIRDTSQKREFVLQDIPQTEACLRKLGAYTGFHGFSGVDFIFDRECEAIYLLEMHARPVAGYQASKLVGVNFAKALNAMLNGKGETFQNRQDPGNTRSMSLGNGLALLLSKETPTPV